VCRLIRRMQVRGLVPVEFGVVFGVVVRVVLVGVVAVVLFVVVVVILVVVVVAVFVQVAFDLLDLLIIKNYKYRTKQQQKKVLCKSFFFTQPN